jgi:hypothetical protein
MDDITSIMLQNIKEIEARDENQILAEIAGETVTEFIYDTEVWDWVTLPDGSRKKQKIRKVKLSWIGTREAARAKGNIIAEAPIITETDEAIRIVVKFTDLANNFSVFGGCHQPKKIKVNDWDKDSGEIKGTHLEDDPYYFQKGLSKAQRNGLTACIPAEWTAKMIDRFLKGGKPIAGQKGQYIPPSKVTKDIQAPPKSQIKPKADWDKYSQEMIPDYPTLEVVIWNLCKMQPKEMYKELGVTSRSDMTITAWDAFVNIKSIYSPTQTIAP